MGGRAGAASTAWQDTEGARLRLVVEDRPDAGGTLRGALEIQLAPGWKTYWREPGDAGVPPQLSLEGSSNVDGVAMRFPAPVRFTDEWSTWAGYDVSMAIALEFATPRPSEPVTVNATAFLGICEDICIPVQMSFMLETDPARTGSEPAVTDAFAALPDAAHEGFSLTEASMEEGAVILEATVPGDGDEAELFLAPAGGWALDVAERVEAGKGVSVFRAVILSTPKGAAPPDIDYTLVRKGEAVNGQIQAQ
ncbi:protein-disulfide reductase DsbD domain-containing protein [Zhengella sp. ZM62]|uniref:protein-disulfide reductase DsbD domain-containing protein n=1 Tax=Zhengella sedimenti TaxID=3390035 RepID=UPI003974D45A